MLKPFVAPRLREDVELKEAPLHILQCEDKDIARAYIANLAMFDARYAKKSFVEIYNEIFACTQHNQYALLALKYDAPDGKQHDTPVAYILWANFNEMSLAMYSKGIRMLSPGEFKSGDDQWLVQMCCPFFNAQDDIIKLLKREMPGLVTNDKIKALDLFEKIL